ncbi:NERD domain-containing protein [Anaerococcus sp. Marseille-Q7828]|uniref:NERD domain-containing protein n=1 Tax=Anaerococcus sp. Marseille-Q7828 TaxID=3036300 RepID=UPI0024AE6A6F|nr:NERD domain-containing protein [Anaerococcus sp. Marseille-Q7828]
MALKLSIAFFIGCILLVTVFRSKFKGDIGELATALLIKDLDRDKYIKLHDIKLKNPSDNTKTTQIDHIVISCYGIFCIETKGYKGKIYGKEFSNQWTQNLSGKKYYFMNPIFQNYAHIKALEAILKPYYPDMVYHSIIAFSGEANLDSIEVNNAKVCKIAYVSNVIKSLSTEEVISFDEVKNIEKIIEKNKSYQSDFSHTRDIKKIKKANEEKIKQNICPRCGGQLVERKGKYGEFIGCSNYPKCRFVVNKK